MSLVIYDMHMFSFRISWEATGTKVVVNAQVTFNIQLAGLISGIKG